MLYLMILTGREFMRAYFGDRVRKISGTPKYLHSFQVEDLAIHYGGWDRKRARILALLHDVVEDTDCTLDDIRNAFDEDIAKGVAALSEDKALSWEERKSAYVKHMSDTDDLDVILVSTCDKLHTILSLYRDEREYGMDKVWGAMKRSKAETKEFLAALLNAVRGKIPYNLEVDYSSRLDRL